MNTTPAANPLTAMQYLTEWRMNLAYAHLQDNPEPLSAVAHRFGYDSEAAFSRAFKRLYAMSPGSVRRQPRSVTLPNFQPA